MANSHKAYKRILKIVLKSKKLNKQIVLGDNVGDNLEINCLIYKYMSALKDNATITISNLTYGEVVEIINDKYFDVDIYAGYKNGNVNKVFSGGILHISNELTQQRTNNIIILCASKMLAQFGQNRINLSLNSNINMYSALKYICKQAKIKNSNVSKEFANKIIDEVWTINDTVANTIEALLQNNQEFIANNDEVLSAPFSLFDSKYTNGRVIKLNENNLLLLNGYPQLSSDGVDITTLPIFNFTCGDVIKIDNSLFDISISSRNEIFANKGFFFNPNGEYMIFEITYSLQNRGRSFTLNLLCKNRDLISNFIGE